MNIFGIETSCDETAAAVVRDGVYEICSVVSSSADLHHKTGGVVPEVAARKQVEFIVPVVEETLNQFGEGIDKIDALAVTVGPGLIGSLLVGVEAAKALSLAWDKPLIPVNHLVGHIYANWVDNPNSVEFPALGLVVSGGHTDLVLMKGHGGMEFLGGTIDDAAGEAFDKTARLLGLAKYLGGVELSNKAAECTNNTLVGRLPRPMLDRDNYDFSFSGLKTAVRRLVEGNNLPPEVVACEFETAVVDVLVKKTIRAAKNHNVKSILLGGGVSANRPLRKRMSVEAKNINVD
ncbi:tRNA (adenosine(37)-N6)-threonylcarbamoyltransferase complex transferase subunit TsaD, partial [bacterium]|nr:tRNA (adenosine(37)-N6)-threonylcarbamoyltransferase complex transferase subunit TsaD [bacterium]